MNFKLKIFIATLTILIVTLFLNSVLSISSFEKNYINSLIAIYEVAGKSLKSKIEQSMRFGKPLDKFEGMEKLFNQMIDQNPQISQIWIESFDGKILYNWGKNKLKASSYYKHKKLNFEKTGTFKNIQTKDFHIIFIPLRDRSQKTAGILGISFPQKIIYNKVKKMVVSNLSILWTSILTISFCLIFVLAIIIFLPLKKEIIQVSDLLDKNKPADLFLNNKNKPGEKSDNHTFDSALSGFDINKIKNEIELLRAYISKFVAKSDNFVSSLENLIEEQNNIFLFQHRLKQLEDETGKISENLDEQEKNLVNKIIEQNRHTRQILSLMNDFYKGLENSCSQNRFANSGRQEQKGQLNEF